MKIRPLSDRIVVKRLEEERTLASGIVIPDTAAEKPDQGEVLAVPKRRKTKRPPPCRKWITEPSDWQTTKTPLRRGF